MESYELSFPVGRSAFRGGLSGLQFLGHGEEGELLFLTHSDRGPNGKKIKLSETVFKRPFFEPDFQPCWMFFSLNPATKEVKLIKTTFLKMLDGRPLSGRPNKHGDEIAIDSRGDELAYDIHGIDPEALFFDGTYYWMGEEYGPSLLKFNDKGELLKRYVPEDSYHGEDYELYVRVLPKGILHRKVNRGFEGLAVKDGFVYAILQSPLLDEGTTVRILKFNPATEKVEDQFSYPLDPGAEKIGDLTFRNEQLLVLEQNSEKGSSSIHRIYAVDVLRNSSPLEKLLVIDLVKAGYDFAEKVEGMTAIGSHQIAVLNDNDFAANDPLEKTILAVIDVGITCSHSAERP